jgi:hypothetical protein
MAMKRRKCSKGRRIWSIQELLAALQEPSVWEERLGRPQPSAVIRNYPLGMLIGLVGGSGFYWVKR